MPSTDQKSYSEDLYNKRRGYESPNENRHYSYPDEEHGEDDSNAPVVVRIVLPVNLRVGCKIDVQIPRGGFLGGEEFELVIDPRQTHNYESEEEDSRIEQYSLEQRSQRSANSQNTYEEHSRHNANIRHSPEERSQRSTNSKYSVDEQLQRSANTGGNHRQQHMTRINDNGSEFKIEETPDKKKPPLLEVQQNGTTSPIVSLYGPSGKLRSKEALKKARQRARKRGPKREPKLTPAQLQYRKDYYRDSKHCKANGLDLRAYRIANGRAKYNLDASQKTNREAKAKAKAVPVGSPPLVTSNPAAAAAAAPSMVTFPSIAPPSIVACPSIFAAPTPTVGSTPLVSTPIQATPRSVLLARMTPQQKADLRALNQQKSDKLATALEIIKDNRAVLGSALGTMNTALGTMNTALGTMNTALGTMNTAVGFLNEINLIVKSVVASIEGSFNDERELIFSEVKAERGSGQFNNAYAAAPVATVNAGTNLIRVSRVNIAEKMEISNSRTSPVSRNGHKKR